MGWTSFEHYGRDTKTIMRETLNGNNEHGTWQVIKDVTIAGGYVAIIDYLNKKENKQSKFVAVCFILRNKRTFAYKDMTETMGPYITGVSDKFLRELDMMVPVSSYESEDGRKYAKEWRTRCRAANVTKTLVKENVAMFKKGSTFKYGDRTYIIVGEKEKVRFRGNRKAHFAFPLSNGSWIKESQLKKAKLIITPECA